MTELEDMIKKYALINAVEHDGKAMAKSILGKVLSENPDLRSRVLEVRSLSERTAEEVNKLPLERQKQELDNLGGYIKEVKAEKRELSELDITRKGFVVRFAPNPDGDIHLGNARPAVLSYEYAKKYRGKFILRFDDTDPKVKVPEKIFYKWIRDDLKWLGIKWDKEIIASKRLALYYTYAEKLIKMGKAYVCTCGEEWKNMRDHSRACACRSLDSKSNLKRWRRMMKHDYKEGQAVLRIKTDLQHKNPAVRDWAAFRIVDHPRHPLSKKHLWPLYNFASAVDDYLCGITHIFRGQEHSTNETKQRFLYDHFRWEYPSVIILGRFSMSDMVLSKSKIREGIIAGDYSGWDDLRLGTLRSLRRRGYQPQALKEIIMDIGPKPNDITIASENLAAYNRKVVDKLANRYFFIPHPKKIEVKNMKIRSIRIPLHPELKKGFRKFSLTKIFYINADDYEKYRGLEIRLKDLCNIKLNGACEFTGRELKAIPKVQWVPEKHLEVRVFMLGKEIKGYGELNLAKAKIGEVAQLERFGFVKIEKISKNNIVAVFAHD